MSKHCCQAQARLEGWVAELAGVAVRGAEIQR
jgi:hypothetical protein